MRNLQLDYGALFSSAGIKEKLGRHMDDGERVYRSDSVNCASPLNCFGRAMAGIFRRFPPPLASLSLFCAAQKRD
jgi:hypothetical protein